MIRQAVPAPAAPAKHRSWVTSSPNEVQFVLGGLFWGYKNFLSSQDRPSCQFYPSCSEYAIASIRKRGLILGGMAAFDRLTRCNGFSPDQYDKQPVSNKFVDKP
jgi:putative membrane protein insertion efficiency factor